MKQVIQELLQSQPNFTLEQLADELKISVREVIVALPEGMATLDDSKKLWELIDILPSWGNLTVIIQSEGSIFEFKGSFPKGTVAHGYYNFMHHNNPFHGHLLIKGITQVAFVSKPHRGTKSHSMVFLSSRGSCVFKVFLGRNKDRQIIPQQLQKFNKLKENILRYTSLYDHI